MINNLNTVYALFAVVMCLVLGYFALFTDLFNDRLPGKLRYIFSGMMLVYAGFRTFRIIRSHKKSKQENQEI
jgi:hypothetical protein